MPQCALLERERSEIRGETHKKGERTVVKWAAVIGAYKGPKEGEIGREEVAPKRPPRAKSNEKSALSGVKKWERNFKEHAIIPEIPKLLPFPYILSSLSKLATSRKEPFCCCCGGNCTPHTTQLTTTVLGWFVVAAAAKQQHCGGARMERERGEREKEEEVSGEP